MPRRPRGASGHRRGKTLPRRRGDGRFLGGFEAQDGDCHYQDASRGDATWFHGREWIDRAGRTVYELYYHGGLIRD